MTAQAITPNVDPGGEFVFAIMPFAEPYNSYYEKVIKTALADIGLRIVRSDEIFSPQAFVQTIWRQIVAADAVVAEMSGANANVMYELGLCHAIGKRVVMIARDIKDVPSDLRHINLITYDTSSVGWENRLRSSLQQMLLSPMTDAPVLTPVAALHEAEKLRDLAGHVEDLTTRLELTTDRAVLLEEDNARLSQRALEREKALTDTTETTGSTRPRGRLSSDDTGRRLCFVPLPTDDLTLEMVEVPKGRFTYGTGPAAREVELPSFWMSRFSVTNRQMCTFLNAEGNQVEQGVPWVDLLGSSTVDKCRIHHDGHVFSVEPGFETHPVTYVNYYGASAFCAWMGGELPSSEMWERAARDTNGSLYPWGNKPPTPRLTNVNKDGEWPREIAPVPVDRKPAGASPAGLVQVIGNVWHWTSTYFPDRDTQVVRGGTHLDFRVGGRSVYRFHVSPDGPDLSQGFLCSMRFLS